MPTQSSAVFHCWRARCLAIESCLEEVLASAARGKLATSEILLLAPALRGLIALYDEDAPLDDRELRSIALQVKGLAESLAAFIRSVPEAAGLAALQQELEGTAEDLALSVGSQEALLRLCGEMENGELVPLDDITARLG